MSDIVLTYHIIILTMGMVNLYFVNYCFNLHMIWVEYFKWFIEPHYLLWRFSLLIVVSQECLILFSDIILVNGISMKYLNSYFLSKLGLINQLGIPSYKSILSWCPQKKSAPNLVGGHNH